MSEADRTRLAKLLEEQEIDKRSQTTSEQIDTNQIKKMIDEMIEIDKDPLSEKGRLYYQ